MSAIKKVFTTRPPEPRQLLMALQNVFPEFGDNEVAADIEESSVKLHTIMRHFTDYFSIRREEITVSQLAALGRLLNEAVAECDLLEGAISTVTVSSWAR